MNLFGFGAQRLWRALRTGDTTALTLGAAALLIAWLRRPPKRTLLFTRKVGPGERLVITREGFDPVIVSGD